MSMIVAADQLRFLTTSQPARGLNRVVNIKSCIDINFKTIIQLSICNVYPGGTLIYRIISLGFLPRRRTSDCETLDLSACYFY